jgi:hypothetical protein
MTVESTSLADDRRKTFVLQEIQPGLLGLMDGSVSTLAPMCVPKTLSPTIVVMKSCAVERHNS